MIKKDIVSKVAEQTNMLKSEVEAVIDATLDTIISSLMDGEPVVFRNFGTFKVEKNRAQKGFHFGKGVSIDIPERFRPKLQFSKDVANEINCANMDRNFV